MQSKKSLFLAILLEGKGALAVSNLPPPPPSPMEPMIGEERVLKMNAAKLSTSNDLIQS